MCMKCSRLNFLSLDILEKSYQWPVLSLDVSIQFCYVLSPLVFLTVVWLVSDSSGRFIKVLDSYSASPDFGYKSESAATIIIAFRQMSFFRVKLYYFTLETFSRALQHRPTCTSIVSICKMYILISS